MAPPHGYRQSSVSGSIWSSPGAYGRLLSSLTNNFIKYCHAPRHADVVGGDQVRSMQIWDVDPKLHYTWKVRLFVGGMSAEGVTKKG
jgi:hypothetical protein